MKKKNRKERTGIELVNYFLLKMAVVIDACLLLGYIQDFINGHISIKFLGTFLTVLLITIVLDFITIKKNPIQYRYFASIGYLMVYAVALFGAANDLVFTIAFPIFSIFILYYDKKMIQVLAAIASGLNIADVIYQVAVLHSTHEGKAINLTNIMLQLLTIIIFLLVLSKVTDISNKNNTDKLNKITGISNRLTGSIRDINVQLQDVNDSSSAMQAALSDVNNGISDTAMAVQQQYQQTSSIQDRLEQVQVATRQIAEHINETMNSVSVGNENVSELVNNSNTSGQISAEVTSKLKVLQENLSEMNEITALINSIAFQTNIMALNANVEAAHAGEAGRGFAVVASEISSMSEKTKAATASIDELITNISRSLAELVSSINQMSEVVSLEADQTKDTAAAFDTISANTVSVKEQTDLLLNSVLSLTDANKQIVNSIETISASSEQMMALTNQVLELQSGNAESLNEVAEMVSDLAEKDS